jgi:hypothetical protein
LWSIRIHLSAGIFLTSARKGRNQFQHGGFCNPGEQILLPTGGVRWCRIRAW